MKKYKILTLIITLLGNILPTLASNNEKNTYEDRQVIKTIPSVAIEQPLIFQLRPNANATSSKMTIHNNSDKDIIITGFTCEGFKKTMLHDTKFVDGERTMFEIQQIVVPAHSKKAISPNTTHFMLFNPERSFSDGEYLKINLKTDQGLIPVIAKVVPYRLK